MNKKGFTLIEILAVIVIIGIIGLIGIAAVSNSTERTRKASFATNAKTYIESARSMRIKDNLPYDPKNGELLILRLNALNGTDKIDNFKTEYGDLDLNLCYVAISNDNHNYQYYITLIDSTQHNIVKKEYSIIDEDSVKSSYSIEDVLDMDTAQVGTTFKLNNINYIITSVHDTYLIAKLSMSPGTNPGGSNPGGSNPGGSNPGGTDQTGAIALTVTTKNTNRNVSSDQWVNEGLNYTFTQGTVGNMYYCYDWNNSCTPDTPINNNEMITSLNNETGVYYIRYKIESRTGVGRDVKVFKAKVDVNAPVCILSIPEYNLSRVTLKIDCEDESGVKEYSISDNNSAFIAQSTNTKQINGYRISTFKVKAEDLAGNIAGPIALTEEEKDRVYSGLIDILTEEYEEIITDTPLVAYPSGSIYKTTKEDESTPEKMHAKYGGTWELIAKGRTLVGVDFLDLSFGSITQTGGEKTHLLTIEESGQKELETITTSGNNRGHTHKVTDSTGSRRWGNTFSTNQGSGINGVPYAADRTIAESGERTRTTTDPSQNHTHTVTINGSDATNAHNNLQPYITVYMYVRRG